MVKAEVQKFRPMFHELGLAGLEALDEKAAEGKRWGEITKAPQKA